MLTFRSVYFGRNGFPLDLFKRRKLQQNWTKYHILLHIFYDFIKNIKKLVLNFNISTDVDEYGKTIEYTKGMSSIMNRAVIAIVNVSVTWNVTL